MSLEWTQFCVLVICDAVQLQLLMVCFVYLYIVWDWLRASQKTYPTPAGLRPTPPRTMRG